MYLSLKEARALFDLEPSMDAIRRWVRIGVLSRVVRSTRLPLRHPKPRRVKLRVTREGGQIATTLEWINEFKAACQANQKAGT